MADSNNKVSLGCGTLILIALIVMIFGNSNRHEEKELSNQINTLGSEVSDLKSELKKQADTLAAIKESLDQLKKQPRERVMPPAPRIRVVPAASNPDSVTPEKPLPEN